jgi:murein DD-endopeptidase MepM/ murein hydrolase activator NlpD
MIVPIRGATLPTEGILSYLYPRRPDHKHRGIDLPAPKGTPVYAALGGTVSHASDRWKQGFSGYGRHVVIANADGTFSLYAHLHAVMVKPGQAVAEGDAIGTVGNSTFTEEDPARESGGPHLHFEVSESPYPKRSDSDPKFSARDERIDPIAWLAGAAEGIRTAAGPFDRGRSSSVRLACPRCNGSLVLAVRAADRAGDS